MSLILFFLLLFLIIRLLFLKVSKKNEKEILSKGGVEYGASVSKWLAIVHVAIYLASLGEAIYYHHEFDWISMTGVILLFLSMLVLYWITQLLKGIWTVKLMVSVNHQYNDHWIFKNFKHPNYYFNIIPELIGIGLLCHAWHVMCLLGPIYIWILYRRIIEENQVLKDIIIPNTLHK